MSENDRILGPIELRKKMRYPDTKTFHWENLNPRGKITDDCVIQSIAMANNMTWEETYRKLFEFGLEYSMNPFDSHAYNKYLKKLGWIKNKRPAKTDGRKYTVAEWCKYLNDTNISGPIIAHVGMHHIACIMRMTDDGNIGNSFKVIDTWNCENEMIGSYWSKGG